MNETLNPVLNVRLEGDKRLILMAAKLMGVSEAMIRFYPKRDGRGVMGYFKLVAKTRTTTEVHSG